MLPTHKIQMFAVSDEINVQLKPVTIKMNLFRFNDFKALDTIQWQYNVVANDVTLVNEFDLHAYLSSKAFNINEIFVEFYLIDDSTDRVLSKSFVIPGEYANLTSVYSPKHELKLSSNNCDIAKGLHTINLEVKIQKPALFTSIVFTHDVIKKYRLSKNGFMQFEPIDIVEVTFDNPSCGQKVNVDNFKIHSLNQFLPGYTSASSFAYAFLSPILIALVAIIVILSN